MFNGLTQGVAAAAAEAAKRSVMKLAGAVIAGVGVAFLTVAVWIYIASQTSHIVAAALLGFVYLVAGGIVMLLGKADHPTSHPAAPAYAAGVPPQQQPFAAGESVVPPLVSAFFFGLNAAQQSRSRDKKPF